MLETEVGMAPLGDVEVAIPSVNVLDVSAEVKLVEPPVGPISVDELEG